MIIEDLISSWSELKYKRYPAGRAFLLEIGGLVGWICDQLWSLWVPMSQIVLQGKQVERMNSSYVFSAPLARTCDICGCYGVSWNGCFAVCGKHTRRPGHIPAQGSFFWERTWLPKICLWHHGGVAFCHRCKSFTVTCPNPTSKYLQKDPQCRNVFRLWSVHVWVSLVLAVPVTWLRGGQKAYSDSASVMLCIELRRVWFRSPANDKFIVHTLLIFLNQPIQSKWQAALCALVVWVFHHCQKSKL